MRRRGQKKLSSYPNRIAPLQAIKPRSAGAAATPMNPAAKHSKTVPTTLIAKSPHARSLKYRVDSKLNAE